MAQRIIRSRCLGQAGDGVLASYDLPEAIAQVFAVARSDAIANDLAFDLEIAAGVPERVLGDSQRLRQILFYVLSNAITFTPAGSIDVLVNASVGPQPGCTLIRIEVDDSGIGIDPAVLWSMFGEPAVGDDPARRGQCSAAAGLSVARALTESIGGTMRCERDPGRGTTVWFEVPVELPPQELGHPDAHAMTRVVWPRIDRAHPLILVAQPGRLRQAVTMRALARTGFRAELVDNGRDALRALATPAGQTYAAVLIDVEMPVLNGYEATAALRQREHPRRHTPVVAMVDQSARDPRDRCLAAGIDDYITMPINHRALHDTLRRWIPERASTTANAQRNRGDRDGGVPC